MTQPRFFPAADDYASRAFVATGMFMLALLFALAPAAWLDERTIDEVSVWWKPLKFCLALGVHFLTVAALAQLLAPASREGFPLRAGAFAMVAAGLFEIVYIALQSARGRRSHFNYETEFESQMYMAMGAGALVLVLVPLMIGVMLALQRDGDRSGVKLGAVLGLIGGPLLTIAFAGYMSMSGSHFAGRIDAGDAGGLPLFGWSRAYPDLRPAHFAATHMIQILPAIGYIGDRLAPALARRAVFAASALLGAFAAGLFAIALSGRSPLGFLN